MSEPENPNSIDAQLRNVALPPGLLPRLREIAALGDAELDHLLRDVSPPAGMLDRLRQIGTLSDADIDAELRDVPLPAGYRSRLARTVWRQADRARWLGLAVAASLLAIVVGAAILMHGRNEVAQQPSELPIDPAPRVLARGGSTPPADAVANRGGPQNESPENRLPSLYQPPAPLHGPDFVNRLAGGNANSDKPLVEPAHAAPPPRDPLAGLPLQSPEFIVVVPPLSRGIPGPRVPGYDVLFAPRFGAQPFVIPSANPALRESRVPIWSGTQSYQLACRLAEIGKLPAAEEIHTEDFLAAMDYGFPLPTDLPLGIRTAAGPSPFSPTGMSLLQIGVQAGQMPRDPQSATHLILVIDRSSAMRSEGRWEQVRRAVAESVGQFAPGDRLSVVLMGRGADVFARRADRAQAERILAAWPAAASAGSADVAAALEAAASLAQQPEGKANKSANANSSRAANLAAEENLATRIVLLADGLTAPDSQSIPRIEQLLHDAVAAGADWEMIDVRQDELLDEPWKGLAVVGGRSVRHAATSEEIGQRLLDTLAGQSQVVADGVSLTVTFNPAAVARYRLIGHEATGLGGLAGAPLESKMRSRQSATALYEVELKPDGPEQVATVELTWREPFTERPRTARQAISRQQFAPLWRETPLALQLGALAAETGEILRGSYFAPPGTHSLEQVAALADQVNPALAEQPAFMRLKQLIELARAARQAGPPPARGRGP